MRAPSAALFSTNWILAARELPPVSSHTRASRKGVDALPFTPCSSASRSAWAMAASMSALGMANWVGIGLATTAPPASPSSHFRRSASAMAAGLSRR